MPRRLHLTSTLLRILMLLAEKSCHGYRILTEIEERTDGRARLGPSSLYWALGRLERAGLIEEIEERPAPELDDERRRYWELTALGRQRLIDEVREMAEILRRAEDVGLLPPSGGNR